MQTKFKHRLELSLAVTGAAFLFGAVNTPIHVHQAHAAQVYDISQWQGYLSNAKVRALKREVPFVILRAQDGGLYTDSQFNHNARLMQKYHLPYGVYSYNLARTSGQAKGEAYALVHRAPHAKFYVNDDESTNGNPRIASAARAWAREIHHLTRKPAILYSYSAFVNENLKPAVSAYDGVWLAQYSAYEPSESYHYDLWQFTDNHYSQALGQRLDDSTFPNNAKPLSFWIGSHNGKMTVSKRGPRAVRRYRARRHARKGRRFHANHSVEDYYSGSDLSSYVNHGYYTDPSDSRFVVTAKHGIELYSSTTGRKLHHLRKGQHFVRGSYQLFYHPKTGLTTRGVGVWHGHEVAFTMRKSQVRAY